MKTFIITIFICFTICNGFAQTNGSANLTPIPDLTPIPEFEPGPGKSKCQKILTDRYSVSISLPDTVDIDKVPNLLAVLKIIYKFDNPVPNPDSCKLIPKDGCRDIGIDFWDNDYRKKFGTTLINGGDFFEKLRTNNIFPLALTFGATGRCDGHTRNLPPTQKVVFISSKVGKVGGGELALFVLFTLLFLWAGLKIYKNNGVFNKPGKSQVGMN